MSIRKISVVTVCLNARDSIRLTLESVAHQTFSDVEHVIIDGGSEDDTQSIVQEYPVGYFLSEKDNGVYHAMDKGAQAASGDILIFLNAGDTFYDDTTCEEVATYFDKTRADIVFGNLMPVYLKATDTHNHGAFIAGKLLDLGYVRNRRQLYEESIHHQATFYRRWIFKFCPYLCSSPEANGEYNVLLNAVMKQNACVKHIPRPVTRFVLGGISTRDFDHEWERYIKARDILRQLYCPDPEAIKVRDVNEFCHGEPVGKVSKPNTRSRLKKWVKSSLIFRAYKRISHSLALRMLNLFTPKIRDLLEMQTQRLFNDLDHTIKFSLKAHEKSVKAALDRQLQQQSEAIGTMLERGLQQQSEAIQTLITSQLQQVAVRIDTEFRSQRRLGNRLLVNMVDLSNSNANNDFSSSGFQVFSQWDEDGLIQYLITRKGITNHMFVEIGVGDYSEANTRLLLQKENWAGLIVDCSKLNIEKIRSSELYWRYSLTAVNAFVNCENINSLLLDNNVSGDIGLLSIDVDGVDYWIWDAITVVSPQAVICEYNGIYGSEAKVTVPYDPEFDRTKKHFSWLYAGASLAALTELGKLKDYTLIGTNGGGNNAFFIRNDMLESSSIRPSENLYTKPKFRESRNLDGSLSYLDIAESIDLIKDMEVYDMDKDALVKIRDIPIAYG